MPECEATQEKESTAIVTGLASGIGRARGERLRDAGWRVIGIDLRDEAPPGTELLVGDAADDRVLQSALGRAEGLRGLVYAAGLPPRSASTAAESRQPFARPSSKQKAPAGILARRCERSVDSQAQREAAVLSGLVATVAEHAFVGERGDVVLSVLEAGGRPVPVRIVTRRCLR